MKHIYIILGLLFFYILPAKAQIPNPSFENIQNITEYKPGYWQGTGVVERSLDAYNGMYAIKQFGVSSQFGGGSALYIALSAFNNSVPYEGKPTHLEFYIKGKFAPGDSLLLSANLSSNGMDYGSVNLDITTISNNYIKVVTPITIYDSSLLCDTVALNFYFKAGDSSYYFLDDIKFTMGGIEEGQLVNGDFETWTTNQYKSIVGWSNSNDIGKAFGFTFNAVKDTGDAHDGNRAIFMQNLSLFGNVIPGAIVTGINNIDMNPAFAVNARHTGLNGYYKYIPSGKDSFTVMIMMFYQGTQIGFGSYVSNTTINSYQKFHCDIIYDSSISATPDSANIAIFAGSMKKAIGGSKAWVDQLYFDNIGIDAIERNPFSVDIYPNPIRNILYINLPELKGKYIIQLFDLEGRLIKSIYEGTILQENMTVETSLSEISSGTYILSVQSASFNIYKKIVITYE